MLRVYALMSFACVGVAFVGCSDTTGPEPSLIAHLSLSVEEVESFLPLEMRFVLDPMKTISRLGSPDSLEVRWDLDGDGTWESDFVRLRVNEPRSLPVLPYRTWSARCEVRDKYGNYSIAGETIALPSCLPVGPDLVVGELIVTDEFWSIDHLDTLCVNTPIYVQLPSRAWDNRLLTLCQVNCYIDGVRRSTWDRWIPGPFYRRDVIDPQGPFFIAEPGTHQLEIEIVAPDYVEEVDLSNNRKTKSVVFVDGDI